MRVEIVQRNWWELNPLGVSDQLYVPLVVLFGIAGEGESLGLLTEESAVDQSSLGSMKVRQGSSRSPGWLVTLR